MLEPEGAQAGQDAPLVGDAVGHDPVERTDAIGGDQEQPIAQVVDVADLAPPPGDRAGAEVGFEKRHDGLALGAPKARVVLPIMESS